MPVDLGSRSRVGHAGTHRTSVPGRCRSRARTGSDPIARRLRAIRDRLRAAYGRPQPHPHRAPVDELVLTVLSQNTNDRNRDVAYDRLRERFDRWDAVRDAPEEEVEEAIRPGGLGATKARSDPGDPARASTTTTSRGSSTSRSTEAARLARARCPGVGRKTAACVLLFSFGRPDVPVDTHVFRVGTRLGLFRPGAPLDEAHDEMLRLARGHDPYEVHVALIRHGRRTCARPRARAAASARCVGMCPYGQGAHGRGARDVSRRTSAELGAGRHRRGVGPDVRDGAGRDRAAADDGVPRLPLHPRGAASSRSCSGAGCASCSPRAGGRAL